MNKEDHHKVTTPPPAHRQERRPIHHSPLFWLGAVLFMAAITLYISTEDLSWLPHFH